VITDDCQAVMLVAGRLVQNWRYSDSADKIAERL